MVLLKVFLAWFGMHLYTFKLTFAVPEKLPFGQLPTRTTTIRLFGLDLRKTVTKFFSHFLHRLSQFFHSTAWPR